MDANKKKKMLKAYSRSDKATLLDLKTKAEEFLTTPGAANPEEIQEAKDSLEVMTELLELKELESDAEPDADEIKKLRKQLDAANARIAALEAEKEQNSADEEEIVVKMRKGLSREQAIHVIRTNRAHRKVRFSQIGDAKKIKALFPDASDDEIKEAVAPAKTAAAS